MENKLLIVQVTKDRENAYAILKSLASKVRLDILDLLKDKKLNVSDIAEKLDIPQSTISTNLKFLEEAGLVKVSPPCGLCSKDRIIGFLDTPSSFHEPGRGMASLIWFERGFVEYKFPNNVPANRELEKFKEVWNFVLKPLI